MKAPDNFEPPMYAAAVAANPVFAAPQVQYAQPAQPQYAQPQFAAPQYGTQPQYGQPMQQYGQVQQPQYAPQTAMTHITVQTAPSPDGKAGAVDMCGKTLMASLVCLLVLVLVVLAWPGDAIISVWRPSINVTAFAFPTQGANNAWQDFVFDMHARVDVTSPNYFEHEVTLSVVVNYQGRQGLTESTECPCTLAQGHWNGVLVAKEVWTETIPMRIPVSMRNDMDVSSLYGQAQADALFTELTDSCHAATSITLTMGGWLNYTSRSIPNQNFETSEFKIACPQVMLSAMAQNDNGAFTAVPSVSMLLFCLIVLVGTGLLDANVHH